VSSLFSLRSKTQSTTRKVGRVFALARFVSWIRPVSWKARLRLFTLPHLYPLPPDSKRKKTRMHETSASSAVLVSRST
jgi:hypothetical protein